MSRIRTFILPDGGAAEQVDYDPRETVVVVNLYYLETLGCYAPYLNNIPEKTDIYIFSSDRRVLREAKKLVKREGVFFYWKENRGRDLSALLVAFHPFLSQYKYLCFLHDKSAKQEYLKGDLEFWVKNLWGNMVMSEEFIAGAIALLEYKSYGVLLPPKPVGEYMDAYYIDPWHDDYENVCHMARQLGVELKIEKTDTEAVAIGSVFWCRTDAMEKLFSHKWEYRDFPDEPMPDDGTVSHAVERIIGFVALDAGYQVGHIVTAEYAAQLMGLLQRKMERTYEWLWENIGVKNTYQLGCMDEEKKRITEMFARCEKVFLYGAGACGEKYLQRLLFWECRPAGFLVSDGRKKAETFCGYRVYELKELIGQGGYGIIITAGPKLQQELEKNLVCHGIHNYCMAVTI